MKTTKNMPLFTRKALLHHVLTSLGILMTLSEMTFVLTKYGNSHAHTISIHWIIPVLSHTSLKDCSPLTSQNSDVLKNKNGDGSSTSKSLQLKNGLNST